MTWVKIDDHLHSHPKIIQVWVRCPVAVGLHLLALSHCAHYLTDGRVSEDWARSQGLSPVMRRRSLQALEEAGLWEPVESGWLIHDYLDYNESRQEVLERRSKQATTASEAGRRGASKRWRNHSSPYGELIAPDPNPVKASRSHPSIEEARA